LFMGFLALKLKNKLTLYNYLTLIGFGAVIRVLFPYIPFEFIISTLQ